MQQQLIMMLAGEDSGDKLAAELVNSLNATSSNYRFAGMGGKRMRAAGVDIIVDNKDLAIIGFWEVLKNFRLIRRTFKTIKQFICKQKPSLLICVDYPGFNLRIAKYAKRKGIKVLYYVSPQIWAWHASRIKQIKRDVDHMAVLFPFEEAIYQQANVPVTVVGHPLLNTLKPPNQTQARTELNVEQTQTLIALLPGSRLQEITTILPVMLQSVAKLKQTMPNLRVLIALADNLTEPEIDVEFKPYVQFIKGKTHDIIAASDLVICASGTATLEVALMTKPLIIVYITNWINYHIAKRFIKTKYIGLCNIIANKPIVREFIQHDANIDNIYNESLAILNNESYRQQMITELKKFHLY